MAGFVASNVLRGDLALWYAEDYPAGHRGRADHRRARTGRVRHLAPARRGERPAQGPARGPGGLGPEHAHPALLRRRLPLLPRLPLARAARLHRRQDALRRDDDVPRLPRRRPERGLDSTDADDLLRRDRAAHAPAASTGVVVDLDCTGLACPGPIMQLQNDDGSRWRPGDEVLAHVSDPGFRPRRAGLGDSATATPSSSSPPRAPASPARFRKGGPVARRAGRADQGQEVVRRLLRRPRQGARGVHHRQRRGRDGRRGLDVLHVLGPERPAPGGPAQAREGAAGADVRRDDAVRPGA